jgi:hypothetical protein
MLGRVRTYPPVVEYITSKKLDRVACLDRLKGHVKVGLIQCQTHKSPNSVGGILKTSGFTSPNLGDLCV